MSACSLRPLLPEAKYCLTLSNIQDELYPAEHLLVLVENELRCATMHDETCEAEPYQRALMEAKFFQHLFSKEYQRHR